MYHIDSRLCTGRTHTATLLHVTMVGIGGIFNTRYHYISFECHALSSHIESELGSHRDWSQGGIQDHLFTVSSPEPARKADLVRLVALLLEDLAATLVRSSEQNETDKHVHAPLRA